jgi:hypothetical protein
MRFQNGKQNAEMQLCAFDIMALDGDDLRRLLSSSALSGVARRLD